MRCALVLAALVALAAPASAFAHASIRSEFPSYRQELTVSPHWVDVRFDQTVELLPNAIEVFDARGKDVAKPAHLIERGIVAPLPKLPKGPYTVRWKALSTDSHVVSGVYTFGVGVPAPNVSDAVGAEGPGGTEDVVRWLYFVGLALLTGGLGFELLVARVGDRRHFWWLLTAGVVVTLEVGIVGFLLRAEDALQLPFSQFVYGDLAPISGGTRFGQAFIVMELGFAFVSAFVFLAWLTERRVLLWPAFLLALGLGSGLSLSGHSSVSTAQSLADWFHLSAATLWIGGLVQLALVRHDAVAFRRFSRLATICVGVLVAAGTYLAVERLPAAHDLWSTSYGHILLVKLGLVCVALLWGAFHQFLVLPRLDASGTGLMRSLLAEGLVATSVLLVAAILVNSKPPEKPPRVPSAAHAAAHSR